MSDKNNHSFNVEFASRYGIEEALIFGDIYYWCLHNKENGINLKKGKDDVERYYTFNSVSSLQETYKYMALTKVYRVIKALETEGLIITGCFNKRVGDRTRWYAVTEYGEKIYTECIKTIGLTLYNDAQFSNCKLQNETHNFQNDRHNLQNEIDNFQNETTLPNSNSNSNKDTNSNSKKALAEAKKTEINNKVKEIVGVYSKNFKTLYDNFKVNTENPVIDYSLVTRLIKKLLNTISQEQIIQAVNSAMNDTWIVNQGYSLSVILSSSQINKLLNGKPMSNTKTNSKSFMNVGHKNSSDFLVEIGEANERN